MSSTITITISSRIIFDIRDHICNVGNCSLCGLGCHFPSLGENTIKSMSAVFVFAEKPYYVTDIGQFYARLHSNSHVTSSIDHWQYVTSYICKIQMHRYLNITDSLDSTCKYVDNKKCFVLLYLICVILIKEIKEGVSLVCISQQCYSNRYIHYLSSNQSLVATRSCREESC